MHINYQKAIENLLKPNPYWIRQKEWKTQTDTPTHKETRLKRPADASLAKCLRDRTKVLGGLERDWVMENVRTILFLIQLITFYITFFLFNYKYFSRKYNNEEEE